MPYHAAAVRPVTAAPGRMLVIGADSLIGEAVMAHYAEAEVMGTSRRDRPGRLALDLAAPPTDWTLPPGVAIAFLCAAMTGQADCEREPELARRINVGATVHLAERLVADGAFVIFLSTTLVFNGTAPWRRPDEPTAPASTYARLKAEAEVRLLALGPRVAVARITKILGPKTPLILGWMAALGRGETIRPFDDMVLAPLSPAFAATALGRVAAGRTAGIVHISAAADITYADAARHLARRQGIPMDRVRPVSRRTCGVPDAAAPAHTTLDTRRMVEELGLIPPAPYEALDCFGVIQEPF